jgi:hypothetical protein
MAAKTGTYTLINSTTVGSDSSSVTFSSIPATYTDLLLVSNWKSPNSTYGNISLSIRFNSDTGTNYSFTNVLGTGSATQSNRSSNNSIIILNYTGSPHTQFNVFQTNILDYSNTTTYKTVIGRDSNSGGGVGAVAGLWRNTSAINSVTILVDSFNTGLATGSTFKLYGIEAGNL